MGRRAALKAAAKRTGAVTVFGVALLAGLAYPRLRSHAQATPDLALLAESVCRPVFQIDGHPGPAGTAFVLHAPAFVDHDVLVAAHHLYGMANAKSDGMPWQDAPRRVRGAVCRSFDGARTWRAGPAVAIAGVHAFKTAADVRDITMLPILAGPPTRLELSPTPALPGDTVWLLAQTEDLTRGGELLHRGRVASDRGVLVFAYDDPSIRTANISGAPIVTNEGKVVGVNVGIGRLANGALFGLADDLDTIHSALAAARSP